MDLHHSYPPHTLSTPPSIVEMATLDDVASTGARLGFSPPPQHADDYQVLLKATDAAAQELLSLPGAFIEAAVAGGANLVELRLRAERRLREVAAQERAPSDGRGE